MQESRNNRARESPHILKPSSNVVHDAPHRTETALICGFLYYHT